MSEYSENKTQFKDADTLCEALHELGFDASMIERHENAVSLVDFQGHRTHYLDEKGDKAEIIIRRVHIGSSANDIGFKKNPDGTISAIISAYDSHRYGQAWLTKLKAAYCEKGCMKQGKKMGLRFAGKKIVNGKVQLQFLQA